jgi:hypothetical protein
MTYRTLRVLTAIAQEPLSSNRRVAAAAGIVDEGQASKLLARLAGAGMIANVGRGGRPRGSPNAWTLTPAGELLLRDARATADAARGR